MNDSRADTAELLKIAEWHLAELQAEAELRGAAIAATYQRWRLRASELRQTLEGTGEESPVVPLHRAGDTHAKLTTPGDKRR